MKSNICIVDKCEADGRSVCKNGGFCLIDGEGLVTCMCPKEFEGQHCEISKKIIFIHFMKRFKIFLGSQAFFNLSDFFISRCS